MCLFQTPSHSVLLMDTSSSMASTRLSSLGMVNLNPLFPLAMVTTRTVDKGMGRDMVKMRGGGGDVEPFHVSDFFTLKSSVPVGWSKGHPKILCLCKIYT
jgi:hypothetical protein